MHEPPLRRYSLLLRLQSGGAQLYAGDAMQALDEGSEFGTAECRARSPVSPQPPCARIKRLLDDRCERLGIVGDDVLHLMRRFKLAAPLPQGLALCATNGLYECLE